MKTKKEEKLKKEDSKKGRKKTFKIENVSILQATEVVEKRGTITTDKNSFCVKKECTKTNAVTVQGNCCWDFWKLCSSKIIL